MSDSPGRDRGRDYDRDRDFDLSGRSRDSSRRGSRDSRGSRRDSHDGRRGSRDSRAHRDHRESRDRGRSRRRGRRGSSYSRSSSGESYARSPSFSPSRSPSHDSSKRGRAEPPPTTQRTHDPRSADDRARAAYPKLVFMLTDHQRTEEQLNGERRPEYTINAGPIHTVQLSPGADIPLVMTEYNEYMLKRVNKQFGWPTSTQLCMRMKLGVFPELTVTNSASFQSFVDFCIGRGESALMREGIVVVKVTHHINPGKNKAMSRPEREKKERPQVTNYKAMQKAMLMDTESEDEQAAYGSDGDISSGHRVGKWNERCNEIVAKAEGGKVLRTCLERRALLKKV